MSVISLGLNFVLFFIAFSLSPVIYGSMTTIYRECQRCGNIFILPCLAVEQRGGGKFCSNACKYAAHKQYQFNEHFFDQIDNHIKAYWLGFCFADANNTGNNLDIKLSLIDRSHLESMLDDLSGNQKIKTVKNKPNDQCRLRFCSTKMCAALSQLGCTTKKSFTIQYPNIDQFLNRHFIRGVFDGDGCCYCPTSSQKRISIISASQNFITSILNTLKQEINVELNLSKQGKCFNIGTSRRVYVEKIYDYFYEEPSRWLERKHVKMIY